MSEDNNSVRTLLTKTMRVATPDSPPRESADPEYTPFAQGRISRQTQLMLMLHRADGAVTAISYASLLRAEASDAAAGFTLDFGQDRVRITGRNLDQLLRLICQHRVAEIREASRSETFSVAENAPIIETIEVQNSATFSL